MKALVAASLAVFGSAMIVGCAPHRVGPHPAVANAVPGKAANLGADADWSITENDLDIDSAYATDDWPYFYWGSVWTNH